MYKRKLNHFDFSKINKVFSLENKEDLKKGLELVRTDSSWLLPQIMAFLGNSVKLVRDDAGKISFTNTLRNLGSEISEGKLMYEDEPVSSNMMQGIIRILKHSPRGEILYSKTSQNSVQGRRWSAAVPLFCSAFKEYRNVSYSEWDWADPNKNKVLDKDFVEYSDYFGQSLPYSDADILLFRQKALMIKSGLSAGKERKPESTTTVFTTGTSDFDSLPRLLKLAICQLWVFMPQFRHDLMITNFEEVDKEVIPLVAVDPFVPSKKEEPIKESEFPWDV